jgi:hypothetical protein
MDLLDTAFYGIGILLLIGLVYLALQKQRK